MLQHLEMMAMTHCSNQPHQSLINEDHQWPGRASEQKENSLQGVETGIIEECDKRAESHNKEV